MGGARQHRQPVSVSQLGGEGVDGQQARLLLHALRADDHRCIGRDHKNVIAIAVGISYGMGFGDNTAALLITRGLAEMSRMVVPSR